MGTCPPGGTVDLLRSSRRGAKLARSRAIYRFIKRQAILLFHEKSENFLGTSRYLRSIRFLPSLITTALVWPCAC